MYKLIDNDTTNNNIFCTYIYIHIPIPNSCSSNFFQRETWPHDQVEIPFSSPCLDAKDVFALVAWPIDLSCLVVEPYPSEKWWSEFVSWDDEMSESQLGWWNSQLFLESHKIPYINHVFPYINHIFMINQNQKFHGSSHHQPEFYGLHGISWTISTGRFWARLFQTTNQSEARTLSPPLQSGPPSLLIWEHHLEMLEFPLPSLVWGIWSPMAWGS